MMLPGSSVLMSHSELLAITGPGLRNAGSLQLLPITESGRSTPASVCSNATVADIPYSGSSVEPCNETPVPVLTGSVNRGIFGAFNWIFRLMAILLLLLLSRKLFFRVRNIDRQIDR